MSISCKRQENKIIVMGNTYPHKEEIKKFGARFNGQLKTWEITYTDENWQGVKSLCESLGGGAIEPAEQSELGNSSEPSLPAAIVSKVSKSPTELKKLSGEIPKSFDIKSSEVSLPKKLEELTGGKDGMSVSQLMYLAAQKVTDAFPIPIWIIGEIQNLNIRGQSIYLSLADGIEGKNAAATTTVNAVIWQSSYQMLVSKHGDKTVKEIFEDGVKIRVLAQVSLYKNRGQLSVAIKDVDPSFTKGDLALKREELIKELKADGLFDSNKRLYLSEFPLKVGLISAEGSRAESDFMHQLTSGGFCGEIIYCPTPMQGDKVPIEIGKSVKKLDKLDCDVIVITRGGGSAADLRWFDAKEVCHAIAKSKTPVISAIGHHDDITIAEDISFAKAKTPTAAAQFILNIFIETIERIEGLKSLLATNLERSFDHYLELNSHLTERLKLASNQALMTQTDRLNQLFYNLDRSCISTANYFNEELTKCFTDIIDAAKERTSAEEIELMTLMSDLNKSIDFKVSKEEIKTLTLSSKLDSLNPRPWVNKGWTQLYSKNSSKKVSSIKDVKSGEKINLRLTDGLIEAEVISKQKR
jgi:exodeoxyribonuclease VII large subunit